METETLQLAQFNAAMSRLRQELRDELEEAEWELHQTRLRSERNAGLFVIWLTERQPSRGQEPVQSAVLWASGMLSTALQLTLALSSVRAFVRAPMGNEEPASKPSSGLRL